MPNDAERQSMQMAYYDEVSTTSTAIKNNKFNSYSQKKDMYRYIYQIQRTSIGIPIRGDGGNLLRSTSSERREQ